MDWHITWQDPLAICLVVVVVVFSAWLRRRWAKNAAGCHGCSSAGSQQLQAPGHGGVIQVSIQSVTLGRHGRTPRQ